MRAEPVRKNISDPLIWRRPQRDEPLTRIIERVARQNPVFHEDEIAQKGRRFADCLPRMATQGIIKRQGTRVYSANIVDQSSGDVATLLLLTGSSATTAKRLERHSEKLALKQSVEAAREALAPTPERLARSRMRVFDFDDAARHLGDDPSDAIARLISTNHLVAIHPRMYRRPGVAEHGREVAGWIARRAESDRLAQQSIDASFRRFHGRDARRAPLRITSMKKEFPVGRGDRRRGRIYVRFNHLGAIYASAGGPNNQYAVWNSVTRHSSLTQAGAEMVAAEIFPRFMRWGDLIEIVDRYNKDQSKLDELVAFTPRGRYDESPRGRERENRMRFDMLREADARSPILPGPCVLYVDHREDQMIVDALTGIANLAVTRVKLGTCDFHARWGDAPGQELFVERKTSADFVASIADGRLQTQLERMSAMRAEGRPTYLMTQGNIFQADPVEVGAHYTGPKLPGSRRIMDATVDIAVHGIPTIAGDSWQHAAEAMLRLVSRSMACAPSATLPEGGDEPKTPPCEIPPHTAAGSPADPSSESTRSDGDASPDT